jgi:hypothetical protein
MTGAYLSFWIFTDQLQMMKRVEGGEGEKI